MPIPFLKLLLFIILTTLISTPCFSATLGKPYSSVEQFVADQKVIRVVLDSGSGFGNQTASLNVMARLRQMGFNGQFDLIYPDDVMNKMSILFNLPDPIPSFYPYESKERGKIDFINYSEYLRRLKNHMIPLITFGITGALEEDKMHGCIFVNPECSYYVENRKFANFGNVKLFLQLSPWFTSQSDPNHGGDDDSIYSYDRAEVKTLSSKGKYLIYPYADFNQAKNYLAQDPNGQAFLSKKPALKTLFDGIDKETFNILPIYAKTIKSDPFDESDDHYLFNMLQIITGARYAQLYGPRDYNKPLVILVLYDYKKEADELMQLIQSDTWGKYEKPGAEQARAIIKKLGLNLPDVFSTSTISDADAIKKIEQLQPGQILLLAMEPLPSIVFDGLYTHVGNNIWPQIREGQNTLNNLFLTGKPHFRCRDLGGFEPGLDLIADPSLKMQLKGFYRTDYNERPGFCAGLETWQQNSEIYQTLGQLIIDAKNSNSNFSRYFQDLKRDATKPENDRIRNGLDEVRKII